MSKFALAYAALLTAFLTLSSTRPIITTTFYDVSAIKAKAFISCTPDRASIAKLIEEGPEIMLMPGSGSYEWKINTTSDSARLYFNQGINMYYGFHIIESIASFKKAARFDGSNPMIWWAQALAYGPNINDVGYSSTPEALSSAKKA